MSDLFTITPDILQIGADAFDALINQLGKPCRLYFANRYIPCPSCSNDPIGNKPSVIGPHGGPLGYPSGPICPLCSGQGRIAEEVYQTVTLLLNWIPKTFDSAWGQQLLRLPEGSVEAKGYIETMPKVSQCAYAQFDMNLAAYANYRFKLIGEPVSPQNIIKGRYFISLWERAAA